MELGLRLAPLCVRPNVFRLCGWGIATSSGAGSLFTIRKFMYRERNGESYGTPDERSSYVTLYLQVRSHRCAEQDLGLVRMLSGTDRLSSELRTSYRSTI